MMLDKTELEQSLSEAKQGNEIGRENLIRHYKPYIINTVGHLSNRYISWSDEETSIGLLAFNRAIDTYDAEGGRSFLNYAYLLIKRDLIDHHRKEKRQQHLSLNYSSEDDSINGHLEIDQSVDSYYQSKQSNDLVEEILELDQALNAFNISFEELEQFSPQHEDTRKYLFEVATTFIEDGNFIRSFLEKKRLPITSFAKKTGYRPKTIERHRKFLITLILLKLHPQWVHLTQFVKDSPRKEESQ